MKAKISITRTVLVELDSIEAIYSAAFALVREAQSTIATTPGERIKGDIEVMIVENGRNHWARLV